MPARAPAAVVHAANYGGAYSGNFIPSLRALEGPCRSMGLRLVLAFTAPAAPRPWVEELRADGISVHLLDRAAPLTARVRALARLAAGENAALLHTHFTSWDIPAAIVGARRGIPVVWHIHSPFPPLDGAGLRAKTAIKLRLLGRSARVAAVSEAIRQEAIRRGCPPRRAFYVPNAIHLAHATRATAGRDAIRHELGVPGSARVALAFGWEPARKGIDLALHAAAALGRSGRPIVLVVVGTDALEAFVAERLGTASPGWLRLVRPREHVADLYAAADVFLSPSRAEGFPYALGEALANGLPAVTSDIPGVEWARDLDATAFFPSGDADALAAGIAEVLDRPAARRDAAAAEARAFAASRLSLEAWAERVAAIYRMAFAERRPPARGDGRAGESNPPTAPLSTIHRF